MSSSGVQKDSGLGLGLYIAQEIIQAHGGTINVASSIIIRKRFFISID